MIAVLSPSKTLNSEPQQRTKQYTVPDFLDHSEQLVGKLRKMSAQQLSKLMSISDKLALENHQRYQSWNTPFHPNNAKPAVLTFQGDVYEGLRAETLGTREVRFAQGHLRILSGLYGALRPLDLIQPYRLEMGTKLTTRRGKDLYAFWGDRITDALNESLDQQKGEVVLVNLASNEYFKSVKPKRLKGRILATSFKEKNGELLKMISFFAKKARGMLAGYIVRHQLTQVEDLKSFREDGYRFNRKLSTEEEFVFTRGK